MLGNFHDDVISIECETNSADLYVVDAEGKYIENIAMHSYLESDVIDAINAKYGTNFTHLTMQKVTGIAIGDDCPNWNGYEKIEIPKHRVAAKMPSGAEASFLVGEIENSTFKVYAKSSGSIISDNSGLIVAVNGPAAYAAQYIIGIFAQYGVTIDTVEDVMVDWEINTYIPNWSQFEILE